MPTEPRAEPLSDEELTKVFQTLACEFYVSLSHGLRLKATFDCLRQENEALKARGPFCICDLLRKVSASDADDTKCDFCKLEEWKILAEENKALQQRAEAAEKRATNAEEKYAEETWKRR